MAIVLFTTSAIVLLLLLLFGGRKWLSNFPPGLIAKILAVGLIVFVVMVKKGG
jgi:hypothetical protein